MSKFALVSVASIVALGSASAALADFHTTYTDATNDLFDNGFGNLDIESVTVHQVDDGSDWQLSISVTTRAWSDWTKYMVFMNLYGVDAASSNPWNRPVDLNGASINTYFGAWVDGAGGAQAWSHSPADGWMLWGSATPAIDAASRTMTLSLGSVSYEDAANFFFDFDVATSGGGNDPGVDHLSRSDMATTGWGTASVAGSFLHYQALPSPGAIALLGLAGLAARRRRN